MDPHAAFLEAAGVPRDHHASGTLDRAEAILAAHPGAATASIHAAAALADEAAVRRFLALDPSSATRPAGPRGWDPLTHLCFSRYLRLDRARSDAFVRTARALLQSGASANSGWMETDHPPGRTWESALYGAAGIARDAALTRLLLEHGADPNDDETVYHSPEGYENEALRALVGSGRLSADSLATMLLRKADWHDGAGVRWLLEHGADPNRATRWGFTALQQAVRRDNAPGIVEAMLDHGADPLAPGAGRPALDLAARRGRADLLDRFRERGFPLALAGLERLIAACALDDAAAIGTLRQAEPGRIAELLDRGGTLLAEFAGNGNAPGVRRLLDLGVPVRAPYREGDPYCGTPAGSTALHVAAWRAAHAVVKLLLERGAEVDLPDPDGRTPLALAVRACVDSHWAARRSTESAAALLRAGASARAVALPTGYVEMDELLRSHRGGGRGKARAPGSCRRG